MTRSHMSRAPPFVPQLLPPTSHLRGPARVCPQADQAEVREHKTHSSGWHLGEQLPGTVSMWPQGPRGQSPRQRRPRRAGCLQAWLSRLHLVFSPGALSYLRSLGSVPRGLASFLGANAWCAALALGISGEGVVWWGRVLHIPRCL